jgi:glucokinase
MAKASRAKASKGKKASYTIGIDLGGTKVAAALVNEDGVILKETRRPSVPPELATQDVRQAVKSASPAHVRKHIAYVINAMADTVMEAASGANSASEIMGVGLAAAGPMNIDDGTLDYPSNFKGWKIVPIVKLLEEALAKRGMKKKVSFQNDAIAAALGEGWVGRARNCSTYAMITVGTGIGSGVIFNGRPAQSGGMGSEWGHMLINAPGLNADRDNFATRTVEGIASGTGIILRAKARGFNANSATVVAEAARKGDKLSLELFAQASEALAALMFSLSLGFHPEKFVVSGGMLAIKDLFLPQAIELYREIMRRKNPKFLAPVQVAQLGTKAGVIGGARLPYLD